MAAKKTNEKKPPVKTDPLETRLRQFVTEVVRDIDDKFDADERAAVVDHVMDVYAQHLLAAADGAVLMSLRDMAEDEEGDVEDAEEEDGE